MKFFSVDFVFFGRGKNRLKSFKKGVNLRKIKKLWKNHNNLWYIIGFDKKDRCIYQGTKDSDCIKVFYDKKDNIKKRKFETGYILWNKQERK